MAKQRIPKFFCMSSWVFLLIFLLFSCASRRSMADMACDRVLYGQGNSQFHIGHDVVFDTVVSMVSATVYDTDTKMPVSSMMKLVRGRDTLVGASDKIGVTSIMSHGMEGKWQLIFSAVDYRCLSVTDVVVLEAHGHHFKVGLQSNKARSN